MGREHDSDRPTRGEITLLRAYVAEGLELPEIVERTGWDEGKALAVWNELRAEDARVLVGRSSEAVFVDYATRTRSNIKRLDDLFEFLKKSNQGSAAVGAIKAQQDLADRVIRLGQDLGLIEKRPDQKQILFAHLDDRALLERFASDMRQVRDMMGRYGDAPFETVEAATPIPTALVPARPRVRSEIAPPPAPRPTAATPAMGDDVPDLLDDDPTPAPAVAAAAVRPSPAPAPAAVPPPDRGGIVRRKAIPLRSV